MLAALQQRTALHTKNQVILTVENKVRYEARHSVPYVSCEGGQH